MFFHNPIIGVRTASSDTVRTANVDGRGGGDIVSTWIRCNNIAHASCAAPHASQLTRLLPNRPEGFRGLLSQPRSGAPAIPRRSDEPEVVWNAVGSACATMSSLIPTTHQWR